MKIQAVDVFAASYPWSGYFKFLAGSAGHRVVFVRVTADDGNIGWGQSLPVPKWSYEAPETAIAALKHYFGPALVGHDPLDIEGAHERLDRALAPGFTTGMPITRAGLDIALHDLAGRITRKSIAELWGRPAGDPVRLSWTVNVRSLDEAEAEVDAGLRRGYHNFNLKIAPDPKFDVELARRVRTLAPSGFLWADANCGYDLASALEAAPKLADAGVDVLEAPLRPNRIRGYQALKKQKALPITMDEGVISPTEAREFIDLGMVDGMTLKVSRCGGLLPARRQIETVLEAGLFWLGSGLTDPDLSLAASLILYGSYGLKRPAALNGPQFLTASVLKRPLTIEGDLAYLPSGPGLGVEIDEARLAVIKQPQ